jgi:autotransporter adhesin
LHNRTIQQLRAAESKFEFRTAQAGAANTAQSNAEAFVTNAANTAQANAIATSEAYTDQKINVLSGILNREARRAAAGTAAALASSYIPQAITPGKGLVGMGVGYWDGQAGFSVGLSTRLNDNRTTFKAGVNVTTEGEVGGGAGIGFEF